MFAILSMAALAGVFSVQVADAQLPNLSVNTEGVGVRTEELLLDVRPETGVRANTEEFDLGVDPRSGVDADTEEFGLTATPQGSVSLIP